MRKLLLLLVFLVLPPASAQEWAVTYGGSNYDEAFTIQETDDGGYIVAGWTASFGAGSADFWILKLNDSGNVEWQKTYGGSGWDGANCIQQTNDGGYVVAGCTCSFGAGLEDVWVLKLDENGNVEWQKTYGGSYWDWATSIQQTDDGGYVVAGYTCSFGVGLEDVWILKLDENGNVEWQKTYGGSNDDVAKSIQQTSDGGYIVAGVTGSFGAGLEDVWVLKLDEDGNVEWQKTYGGSWSDWAESIQQTDDGGYIVAGGTYSFAGLEDVWVLKLDENGSVEWQKTYGGSDHDWAGSIQQTSDGGYIVAGVTGSFGACDWDVWVLKLNDSGNVEWQKTYGGSDLDGAWSIQQTDDGGYIVAGGTDSFRAGDWNVWVLKLDEDGDIPGCNIVGESDAVVTTPYVEVTNTNAIVQETHAIVIDTNANVTTTNASGNYVCYSHLRKPIADFTYEISGMNVTFNASMSYDPDGNIVSYEWEFGDGCNETTTSPIVNHTYSPGIYTVTLTATDNDGLKNTTSKVIAISLEPWQLYDQNHDGKIDDQELINAILDWLNNLISDEQLINIILKWLS